MTTSEPDEHDRGVSALVAALRAILSPGGRWVVLQGARWQPLEDFPDCRYTFDALIVPAGEKLEWDAAQNCFGPSVQPVTVLDVVRRGGWEEEFYDKPDALIQAGVYEYCLWDPTAEVMRPSLQAYRARESVLRRVSTSLRGVFFSAAGFRMEVRGAAVELEPCGDPHVEAELFVCRGLLDEALLRATADRAIAALSAKVGRLQARLAQDRE